MNFTRRSWLTATGALGFSAVLTRCGGSDALSSDAPAEGLAQTQDSRTSITIPKTAALGRVVVVGGGMAGLAAAKYLRLWGGSGVQVTLVERNTAYTSNILSNLVLTGQRTLASLVYSYATAKQNYGIDIRQGDVVGIDPIGRKVTLADRSTLPYDRLIVAPGVEFDVLPGLESAAAQGRVVHAWQAGQQTTTLRNQLVAMPRGGTFVLTIPASPYRCPPGPYERACVIADWLKRNKPGSRVVVLDANASVQAERHTFETAFTGLFAGVISYVPNAPVTSIDATRTRIMVHTPMGDFPGDVVNAIPPHRAGKVALDNGLANVSDGRWAGVDAASFESTAVAGVHVIGDACSAGVPKAGHIGNQEGKTAADAILRAFRGLGPDTDLVINSACYSPITASTASWLTAVYQYDLTTRGYRIVGTGPSEAQNPTADGYSQMNKWFSTLMQETFA
jgi:NADPH-dependent 2,4-dienoyl-CoA reductase/sulfur reductase-like enzyme